MVACGPAALPPPASPTVECGDGQRSDAQGQCAWILPSSDCAPHTHARLGFAECQPIGAGACAPPYPPGLGWGCSLATPSCSDRTQSTLWGDCRPVGWSLCPDGFVEDGGGCRPVFAEACTGATRPAIGHANCVGIGQCGAPPSADLYVDPAGPVDGTHFRAIGPALEAAFAGAVISIAPGTYAESPVITRSVSLHGHCAERVLVRGGITVNGGAVVGVRGLTLSGDRAGLRAQAAAQVAAEQLVIDGSLGAGVRVEGARVELEDVVIRGVRAFPDGSFGRGIDVAAGGTALVSHSAILDAKQVGVSVVGPGSVGQLDDVLVMDVSRAPGGAGGVGVAAAAGGRITGERVVVTRVADIGVLAYQAPSALELGALFVEGTGRLGEGAGARVQSGGAMTLSQATLLDTLAAGVLVTDPSSTATVSEVWISQVRPDPESLFSAGVTALHSGRLRAQRVFLQGSSLGVTTSARGQLELSEARVEASSLGVVAAGGPIRVVDSTLRGPLGGAVVQNGAQLSVEGTVVFGSQVNGASATAGLTVEGSTLSLSGSLILGGVGFGLLVTGTAAVARVTDSVVRDQRSNEQVVGLGIYCERGRLELDRVRVEGVDGLGILAQGQVSVARTTVNGITASRRKNGAAIAVGGRAWLEDVAIVGNQLAGLVLGPGEVQVDGLLVDGTSFNDEGEFGHGLLGEGTTLRARWLELRGSATAGLAMDNSTAHLSRSLIVANVIGAQVQGGSRLVEGGGAAPAPLEVVIDPDVLLLENQTRVGLGTLPLPNPFEAVGR